MAIMAATWLHTGTACGAAARNWLMRAAFVGLEVRQPEVAQLLDSGITALTASLTSGNSCRCPV